MHKLKAVILTFAVIAASFMLATPTYASMGTACSDAGFDDPLLCGTPNQNEEAIIQQKVSNVLNQVYLWIGIIAVVVIVISGIKYMTSRGDAEAVKKAKSGILYASIGLVVVLAAFAITLAVTNAVQGIPINEGGSGGGGAGGGGGGGGGGGTPTETVEVEYIQVSPTSIRLEEGETGKIAVYFVPDYATDRSVTFTSSDTSIVTVNNSGVVTAKKEGTATITVKTTNNKTATVTVEVFKLVEAESVSISPTTATIKIGKTQQFTATVLPEDTNDKSVTWTSSDTSIASVSTSGVVTGKKAGTATITVKTKNNKTATATVTVETIATKAEKIADAAIYMAWPYSTGPNAGKCKNKSGSIINYNPSSGTCKDSLKEEYIAARQAVGGSYTLAHAQDCGNFVGDVMKYTGLDPDFPSGGSASIYGYLSKHPEKWEPIANLGNTSNLKPGDIFVYPRKDVDGVPKYGHVMIYLGNRSKYGDTAHASLNNWVGRTTQGISFKHSSGNPYYIYRIKE